MSVTVAATPILLLSFSKIAAFVATSAAVGTFSAISNSVNSVKTNAGNAQNDFNTINEHVKKLMESNEDVTSEEVMDIIFKEYDTAFVDKDVLIKTLEEHGFENIQTNGDSIMCKIDALRLDFYRNDTILDANGVKEPYTMKISAACSEAELSELVDEINNEYVANTQEESYIKIKERLEQKGLKIDEEEVYEDNTIVLTVNID